MSWFIIGFFAGAMFCYKTCVEPLKRRLEEKKIEDHVEKPDVF
jgi:hypothetical protein